jgi:rhodanese-related sulfurtransferase
MINRALCILLLMSAFATAIRAQQEPEYFGQALLSQQETEYFGQALLSQQEPEYFGQALLSQQEPEFFTRDLLSQQEPEYLGPTEFDYRYKAEVYAIIIDAREAQDYRRGRIPGALGIEDMDKLELFADSMDTDTPLYIYCNAESRSRTVAQYLGEQGFTRLYILKGGIREWKAADMPLDKKRLRRRRR